MASTVFTDFVTPVPAAWLNDVNTSTYVTAPASTAAIAAETAARIAADAAALVSPALTGVPTINASAAQALSNFTGANQSLATNGYQKLPGGLLMQWGTGAIPLVGGNNIITFPIAFPSNVFYVNYSANANNAAGDANPAINNITLTTFNAPSVAGVAVVIKWIAIGV
jgi:hypothetical protein